MNRNVIPFDKKSPFNPSGIRLGSPAITTRGFKKDDSKEVVRLIVQIINNIDNESIEREVKNKVKELCKKFPIYEDFQW